MAESDYRESAIAENAREIVMSRSNEELATVINQLFMRQESEEYQIARALYDSIVSDFPNHLTLKLLKLYQYSSNGVISFQSIYQLSETLNEFRNRNFKLSLNPLNEIKRSLISCLTMKKTKDSDIKILRRIVSFVAYNVVTLYNCKWDELSDCIFLLADQEPLKAFHIFVDLPPVYYEFIDRFLNKVLVKAKVVLRSLEQDWSLALQTVVKMVIQLYNTELKLDVLSSLTGTQLSSVLSSVNKLVKNGKEEFLVKGLEDFERFLSRDVNRYSYNQEQCRFVSVCMIKIGEIGGTQTKEIVRKINMLVSTKPKDDLKNGREEEYDSDWYDHLMNLSSVQVLMIFMSTQLEDRSRELAIRRLNVLLCDHSKTKVQIKVSEFRGLQPLLISCLKEGVSNSMFKVLGEVVSYVVYEMFVYQGDKWDDLRDYIVSRSKTEFQRAVYIFQCLRVALTDDDFVIPVMENLLPEIRVRLYPPRELFLDDDGSWVLAFTGAFCASIHLIETPSEVESVEENTQMMIESVRELVERGMEVGLVRRAFRDVETIVKKQMEWYGKSEYKFLKCLLWRLYAIEGMKWESKIVLWRINVTVERGVEEMAKEQPKDEFDWQNSPDDEEDEEDEEDEGDEKDEEDKEEEE